MTFSISFLHKIFKKIIGASFLFLILSSCHKEKNFFPPEKKVFDKPLISVLDSDSLVFNDDVSSGSFVMPSLFCRCQKFVMFFDYVGVPSEFLKECSQYAKLEKSEICVDGINNVDLESSINQYKKEAGVPYYGTERSYYNASDMTDFPGVYGNFNTSTKHFGVQNGETKAKAFRTSVKKSIKDNYQRTKCRRILDIRDVSEKKEDTPYHSYIMTYELGQESSPCQESSLLKKTSFCSPVQHSAFLTVPKAEGSFSLLIYAHAFRNGDTGLQPAEIEKAVTKAFLASHIVVAPAFEGQGIRKLDYDSDNSDHSAIFEEEPKLSQYAPWVDDYAFDVLGVQDCMAQITMRGIDLKSSNLEKLNKEIQEKQSPLDNNIARLTAVAEVFLSKNEQLADGIKKNYLNDSLNLSCSERVVGIENLMSSEFFKIKDVFEILIEKDLMSGKCPQDNLWKFRIHGPSILGILRPKIRQIRDKIKELEAEKKQEEENNAKIQSQIAEINSEANRLKQSALKSAKDTGHYRSEEVFNDVKGEMISVIGVKIKKYSEQETVSLDDLVIQYRLLAPQTLLVGVDLGAQILHLATEYEGVFLNEDDSDTKKGLIPHYLSILATDFGPSSIFKDTGLAAVRSAFLDKRGPNGEDKSNMLFPGKEIFSRTIDSYLSAKNKDAHDISLHDLAIRFARTDTTYLASFFPMGLKDWEHMRNGVLATKSSEKTADKIVSYLGGAYFRHSIEDVITPFSQVARFKDVMTGSKTKIFGGYLPFQPENKYYTDRLPGKFANSHRKHPNTGGYFAGGVQGKGQGYQDGKTQLAHGDDSYTESVLLTTLEGYSETLEETVKHRLATILNVYLKKWKTTQIKSAAEGTSALTALNGILSELIKTEQVDISDAWKAIFSNYQQQYNNPNQDDFIEISRRTVNAVLDLVKPEDKKFVFIKINFFLKNIESLLNSFSKSIPNKDEDIVGGVIALINGLDDDILSADKKTEIISQIKDIIPLPAIVRGFQESSAEQFNSKCPDCDLASDMFVSLMSSQVGNVNVTPVFYEDKRESLSFIEAAAYGMVSMESIFFEQLPLSTDFVVKEVIDFFFPKETTDSNFSK